jgi:DNA mismatch endonuclease (patch repair protein)
MSSPWKDAPPPDQAWRCPPNLSRNARAAEQDIAAGGRANRELPLPDGRIATASISLRLYPRTRRIRAYLRWSDRGVTRERYVGEVAYRTRTENLKAAWRLVQEPVAPPRETAAGQGARKGHEDSWATTRAVRAVMRANRSRDTKPEVRLRSALFAMGLRYRVAYRPLPGLRRTADVAFTRARVAVFVDGCYWHGCPEHHRPARKNAEFWLEKIAANKKRDAETTRALIEAGWRVIRIWEHDPVEPAVQRIVQAVATRQDG